jgi:hypothetical protein
VPVIGIPFGDENNRDFYGDWFDKNTDVGPLNEGFTYFDHLMDWLYVPDTIEGFGTRIIGKAIKKGISEEGILYHLIVNQRERYLDMIERLANEGYLSVSSMANYAEWDKSINGRIARWDTFAVDFTPTPAEINAAVVNEKSVARFTPDKIAGLLSCIKSFNPGFDLKPQNEAEWNQLKVINLIGVKNMDPAKNAATQETTEDTTVTQPASVTNQVEEIFGDAAAETTPEQTPVTNGEDQKSVLEFLKNISAKLDAVTTEVNAIKAKSEVIDGIQGDIKDLQTAIPAMAKHIASYVKGVKPKEEDLQITPVPNTPAGYKGLPRGLPGADKPRNGVRN